MRGYPTLTVPGVSSLAIFFPPLRGNESSRVGAMSRAPARGDQSNF